MGTNGDWVVCEPAAFARFVLGLADHRWINWAALKADILVHLYDTFRALEALGLLISVTTDRL